MTFFLDLDARTESNLPSVALEYVVEEFKNGRWSEVERVCVGANTPPAKRRFTLDGTNRLRVEVATPQTQKVYDKDNMAVVEIPADPRQEQTGELPVLAYSRERDD